MIRTRFAPSPTGYIHLGNVWVAFLNWLWTRQHGGTIILRVEDIDRGRCREEYIQAMVDDLTWLGLDWDEGPDGNYDYGRPLQSVRFPLYEAIREKWEQEGLIYPCWCSRARLHEIASAPHEGEEVPIYDGHCRHLTREEKQAMTRVPSWRIKTEEETISFDDLFLGQQMKALRPEADDFVIFRADGTVAYQLAVTFDDGAMGVSHVLRGNDLLPSTFYQISLMKKLGYPVPRYCHLPLLVDRDGVRLSKRQRGITIRDMREAGETPADIIGRLLYWAGGLDRPEAMTAKKALGNIPFSTLKNLSLSHIRVI